MTPRLRKLLLFAIATIACQGWTGTARAAEKRWTFRFDGIFRGGTKPLLIYAREVDGMWLTGVGSSRDPDRKGRLKKTYNRSWYYADLSTAPIVDGKVRGRFKVHMTPDLWVPRDHKGYSMDFEIDAALEGDGKLGGTYRIVAIHSQDVSVKDLGRSGKVSATSKLKEQAELPDPVTLVCNMQGSMVGGDPTYGGRCMILSLGLQNGRLVSTARASMDQKFRASGRKGFGPTGSEVTAGRDAFTARVVVPTRTLDMEPCTYIYDIDGHIYDIVLVGTYRVTVKIEGKPEIAVTGSFDGKVEKGVTHYDTATDDRPFYTRVEEFVPPAPGEHPRLLFRRADLPALREKMKTPEGQAILTRLRRVLNGSDGESMTTVFSAATHAYMGGGYKNTVLDEPGAFTIGHAAGYGLLYQLTGDRKYAEFGRQCFEASLSGKRDRDDRYSFVGPGGPLRASPSVGWHAVGYDLCYDGWEEATRERFGHAIAEYAGKSSTEKEKKSGNLEALARGTMPPSSNHFGMQVGGAVLALLAIDGEAWVDQGRIDRLLKIAEDSTTRNLRDGFGDGGFFKEGDGTGSMSSHISFLTGLQAWKTAAGKDFLASEHTNARMIALKWIYQTVVRGGKPDFWPIRGSYGHNVWSRRGVSGGGYFAIGMGPMSDADRSAMKWYYETFLRDADAAHGPYDTVSPYPHIVTCAFVNWPTRVEAQNPALMLPRCYRDSAAGFYLWRNRWRDGNDTVITVLTTRTSGYMTSKPDRSLRLNCRGKHSQWGTVKEGPAKHWSTSPRGETSSLTLSDGTCFGVDFTGASGADVMLVTTGKAEGQSVTLAGRTLTFYFPTIDTAPALAIEGNAAVVGTQRIALEGGNIAFGVKGQ